MFPLLLAILFLGGAALLFVTSTLPALRERDTLLDKRLELARIQERLESALAKWRGREQAMDEDIETLLVEIDRLGLLPEELVADFAQKPPQGAATPPVQPKSKESGRPANPSARSFSGPGSSKRP